MIILNTVDRAGMCVCDRICLDIPIMGIVIVLVTGRKSSLNKFKQSWHGTINMARSAPFELISPKSLQTNGTARLSVMGGRSNIHVFCKVDVLTGALRVMGPPVGWESASCCLSYSGTNWQSMVSYWDYSPAKRNPGAMYCPGLVKPGSIDENGVPCSLPSFGSIMDSIETTIQDFIVL